MAGDWPDNNYQPTVSHSSMALFKACDRAYALKYHHQILPDIVAKHEHKREARLQPLNCFPGSVFHETIQTALMIQQDTGKFPEDLFAIARRITTDYINYSRAWVKDVTENPILGGFHKYWIDHPYAQPVESFYYDGDLPPNFRTLTKEKLIKWFERFVVLSPSLPFNNVSPQKWIFPKQIAAKVPWFVHNDDFAVYASFDFLTKDENNIAIYDWKTGKRSSGEEAVAEQLMTYAAYAVSKWAVSPGTIKLYAVWVDDGSIQEVECDEWEIRRMQQAWESHQHDWKHRLSMVNGDADQLFERFPMTSETKTCLHCAFRSCQGRHRIAASGQIELQNIELRDQ